jgi:chromate transport protein ChrA
MIQSIGGPTSHLTGAAVARMSSRTWMLFNVVSGPVNSSVRRLLGWNIESIMKKLIALILFLLAGVIALVEFIALIDPVGTKMADDADPFGDPHIPWYKHAIFILVIVALILIAYRMFRSSGKNKARLL